MKFADLRTNKSFTRKLDVMVMPDGSDVSYEYFTPKNGVGVQYFGDGEQVCNITVFADKPEFVRIDFYNGAGDVVRVDEDFTLRVRG